MAVTISVASIITDVQQRLRLPTFSSTTDLTDIQVLTWIQQAVRALCAMHRQKFPEDLDLVSSTTVSTIAGFNFATLPADFGELYKISWVKSATEFYDLEEALLSDVEPLSFNPHAWGEPPKYRLTGATVEFYPCPSQVYTVRLWYSNHITSLTAVSSFSGRIDWDEWVALKVCETYLRRNGRLDEAGVFTQDRLLLEQRLFAPSRKRNRASRHIIRDVRQETLEDYYRRRGY